MVNRNFIGRATLIVGLFVLACGFLLTGSTAQAVTTYLDCTDSDGQNNFNSFGEVEVFKDVDGVESSYISYDSCGSHKDGQFYGKTNGLQKVARDYFCKDDNKSSASTFVCEGDDVCISGICTDYNDISIICQDSDNGINEFVTGVTSLDIYVDGIVVSSTVATDSCSEDFLLENYCNENNLFDQNYIKCDDGCENGRCAATPTSTPDCYDSDGGINLLEQGYALGYNEDGVYINNNNYDGCINWVDGKATGVKEFFCEDNVLFSEEMDCPQDHTCLPNGHCVAAPTSTLAFVDWKFDAMILTYNYLAFSINNLDSGSVDLSNLYVNVRKYNCPDQEGADCFKVGNDYQIAGTDLDVLGNGYYSFMLDSNFNDYSNFYDWLTQYVTNWDYLQLFIVTSNDINQSNNVINIYPLDVDMSAEELIDQEEQDAAEDLAGEIVDLEDEYLGRCVDLLQLTDTNFDGTVVTSVLTPKVYYLYGGYKYEIPSEDVYYSWFESVTGVVSDIDPEVLESIPEGGQVCFNAGDLVGDITFGGGVGYGYGYYGDEQGSDFYGYGYYAGSSGSGGGYGYGYNYGEQVNKLGKINKALNPKILPDNPLYVFKLAGKGVRSWLTFDKEKKAKLRMRYAAEKMLEAKLVDPDTAAKHMRRYRRDVEKLQKTLTKVEKNDAEKAMRLRVLAMRLTLKEQVLLGKVEREAPVDRLDRVREARRVALEDIKANAEAIEDPREVRRVFEVAMNVSKNPISSVRNLEILEAMEQSGPSEATRDTLRDLKEQYGRRLEKQVVELAKIDSSLLRDYVGASGNEVNNMKVLNDLEDRVRDRAVVDEAVIEEIESSRDRVISRIENKIEEVRERDRGEAIREILGTTSDESEGSVRVIRDVESRIGSELSASVREVRQKLEQDVEERREEEGLPLASTSGRDVIESYSCPSGFVEQDSFTRDCSSRPENTVCVSYGDGFVWLIEDGIAGWAKDGERVQIAKGNNLEYHHLLGTDCIRTARVGTTAEAVDETLSDESGSATHAEVDSDREPTTREPETEAREEARTYEEPETTGDSATHNTEDATTEVRRTTEDVREATEEIRVDEPVERDVREEEPTVIVEETRCTEDTWECADWSDCSERGEQTRTCRMSYDCPTARTATPTQTQSCTPTCTEDTWECGDWSDCSESGTQDRTCRMSDDCRYASTPSPDTRQSCAPTCTEDTWECEDWSDCSDSGEQTRTCRMSYDCENDRSATPDQTQSCTPREPDPEPEEVTRNPDLTITSLTYDPASVTDGDSVTFYATIYNQAEGDAGASTAYLYIDGRLQGSLSTRTIVSGASQSLTWSSVWPATAGDYTAQVCSDALDVIVETDETNNCSSVRITVAEAVRGGRVSLGVDLWEDFVSFFVPVTRAFRFGSEVLESN